MVSRIAAFVIWAAVAASIVFWALQFGSPRIALPPHATMVSTSSGLLGDVSRVFGADAPQPSVLVAAVPLVQADARYKLIGVVAPRSAAAQSEGLALIGTEGKPPRAYRVGSPVDGDMVLLGVHSRGASLGPKGQAAQVALELPALPLPATGSPPGVSSAVQLPRSQVAMPQRLQPAQVPTQGAPVRPPASSDTDEADSQPEPTNRRLDAAPPGAGPGNERRPPG